MSKNQKLINDKNSIKYNYTSKKFSIILYFIFLMFFENFELTPYNSLFLISKENIHNETKHNCM